MKTLKQLTITSLLTLVLVTNVSGGDMPGPGVVQTVPPPASAQVDPANPGPVEGFADTNPANASAKATPNLITEATIFAIRLVMSMF